VERTYDACQGHLCGCCISRAEGLNRREFLWGVGVGLAAGSLEFSTLSAAETSTKLGRLDYQPTAPEKLRIQPVLTVKLFQQAEKTSWRPWGGFHTPEDIESEKQRIKRELDTLVSQCEFGLDVLPLITLDAQAKAAQVAKQDHDVLLMYAANSWVNVLEALTNPEKWTILFLRHKSGPVYLWYEVAHNRYLRKTVDQFGQPGVDHRDVVVDSSEELKWRFRSLYGLKNALGKRVVCVGGPAGWGYGGRKAPEKAQKTWKMDLQTVGYPALSKMIKQARQNDKLVKHCIEKSQAYLKQKGIVLETKKEYVTNAFILTEIFKDLMDQAGTDAFTINNCMGAIMGKAETTACLTLSLLNDNGYTAYCESDFVAIPSGLLLHYIASRPAFLNDPTYPHDGVVTLAHCTAPRKMDGKNLEPARIMTHFESDFGAAPKVEMKIGQNITVIDPDFDGKRWLGFEGQIIDNPFLDICRSQIDVRINGSCEKLNAETRGFHWMVCYGNYLDEVGYALRKVGIDWLNISA